ncbi:MAG: Unknown protein [uncultured Sulfurovum sp.]|uniref:Uncharacterized protein n=1 Tax=uncultured Sulfurovum sp. TaxID=269237 RepID=A0A6S6SSD0_9BACT|nr:MAG: Unknown protein [uncultured Sulfurovum sp.]
MANSSELYATLSGYKIKDAYRVVLECMEDGHLCLSKRYKIPEDTIGSYGYSCVEIPAFQEECEETIVINGMGRWCGPHAALIKLCEEFNLDMTYNDAEPGCDFFHTLMVNQGKVTLDEEYAYLSKERADAEGCIISFIEGYDWLDPKEDETTYLKLLSIAKEFEVDEDEVREVLGLS